jgi:hypothetical protein
VRRSARELFNRAVSAAASLTGKRFGLLVASSIVATSAIVVSALTNPANDGLLAAALAHGLQGSPQAASAVPEPSEPALPSGGESGPSAPLASEPAPLPEPLTSEPVPETTTEEPPPKAPEPPALPEAGRIKHVFVVSLASPGYEQSFGAASQMPYLSGTLRPQGELLSNYTLLDGAGLANSIAAVAGQPPNPQTAAGCSTYAEFPAGASADKAGTVHGSGCVYPVETLTLADQLTSGRFSWRAYMGGMVDEAGKPDTCVHPGSGEADPLTPGAYSTSQNPFAYFHSLLDLGDCAINDVPLDGLSADLGKGSKAPNYSFIAPDPCDAGVPGQCAPGAPDGAAAADAFLAEWAPKILTSRAFKAGGLLVIAFDAAPAQPSTGAEAVASSNPLQVGALLVSPFVAKGATDSGAYNPYVLFRSSEELFGLQPIAKGKGARTFAPALLGETGGD